MDHIIKIEGIVYVRTNGYRSNLAEVERVNFPGLKYAFGGQRRMIYADDPRHPDCQ